MIVALFVCAVAAVAAWRLWRELVEDTARFVTLGGGA